jgi:LysM repeat protein/uncharacterized protein YukE
MSLLSDIWGAVDEAGHTVEGMLHPGGDPEAIFAAAAATRTLAVGLQGTTTALDSVAAGLENSWQALGPGEGESAAGAFQKAWGTFGKATEEYAENLGKSATTIDSMGTSLQEAQSAANKLWLTIDATLVVGAAMTIFTFGVSDEAAVAMAETDILVTAGAMTAIEGFIANSLILLDAAVDAFLAVSIQFILGAFADGAAIMWGKWQQHQDPFSPDSYTADDLSNVALGGLDSMLLGWAWNKVPALAAFSAAHPIIDAGLWNATAAFTWALPWDFWIQGNSLTDKKTWLGITESTLTSAVTAPALRLLGKAPLASALFPEGEIMPGVTGSDITNNVISIPISGEKLVLFTGDPLPPQATAPQAGTAPGQAAAADLPAPDVAAPPPHIGGGKYTVAPGDSLYEIAGKVLKNPDLYPVLAAANPLAVGPDATVIPGSKLLIPVLPQVPAGSVAQVVQPGQSLSVIAGGNQQLAEKIAQLNSLNDTAVLYPGQVLIVPPAS